MLNNLYTTILSFLVLFMTPTEVVDFQPSVKTQEVSFKKYLSIFSTEHPLSGEMVKQYIPGQEKIEGRSFSPRGIMSRNSSYVKVMVDLTCESSGSCNGILMIIYNPNGTILSHLLLSHNYGDCNMGSSGSWLIQNKQLIIMQESFWKKKCDELIGEIDQYKITEYRISTQGKMTVQREQNVTSEREYPAVSVRLLSDLELEQMTLEAIAVMRNELFATYGYRFKSEELSKYFKRKKWYTPLVDEISKEELSILERKNLQIILNYEKNQK